MGAYNWITVEAPCPVCGRVTILRAQTHIASSYSGDASGRFHDRTYGLGERVAWFTPPDERSCRWSECADPGHLPLVHEACYSECSDCRADLCVVLAFENASPADVVAVSAECDWPTGYLR